MKHVVIVGKFYPPTHGGVERYASDIVSAVSKKYRVTVVVHNTGAGDVIEAEGNVTVIRCGTPTIRSSQPLSPSMFGHLRALEPDLVHFNAPNFYAAAMLLLVRYKAPLIVTHHADVFGRPILRRMAMPIYRRLVRRAKCIVVNSLKNAVTSKDLPRSAGPFVEIPWGVDASAYNLDARLRTEVSRQRRERFGSAPVVGFIGRFVRYKGLQVLIQALEQLDGVHGLLIGDGPLLPEIIEQVRTAGISNRVHFLGAVDESSKIRALAMMDLLILPSVDTTEAFGLAQVEAQLMSLPVVVSRLPTGVTDVTVDHETGLLVPPRDPNSLAKSIAQLIEDPVLARRLGVSGHQRALGNFTLDVFRRRINELFDIVLSGRSLSELADLKVKVVQQMSAPT